MLSYWFLLLGRLPSIVYRNTDKENVKKKKSCDIFFAIVPKVAYYWSLIAFSSD